MGLSRRFPYTSGPPTHVTISSTDPAYQGLASLEMLFHESSHSPVSDLFQRVRHAASEQKVSVPPQLWHGVLSHTAGELTRRELEAHGIAYTPYARPGLYTNLCGAGCREKIAEQLDAASRRHAIDCRRPVRARCLVQVNVFRRHPWFTAMLNDPASPYRGEYQFAEDDGPLPVLRSGVPRGGPRAEGSLARARGTVSCRSL